MRILYHHRTRYTDAQRVHIAEIVRAFSTLGHFVRVVSLARAEDTSLGSQDESQEAGWKKLLRKVPFAYEFALLGYNLIGVPWLLWRIWRDQTDFVYERYGLLNFAGVVAARLTGRPVVLEVNAPFALELYRDSEIRTFHLAAWSERVICNAATRVVAVSGPLRDMLVADGVDPSRIVLVPNGVNLPPPPEPAASDSLRAALQLTGKVVIGFTGWFRKWHGLELLVDAFAAAGLHQRGAALLLVGDGPAMPDLKRCIARNGLDQHVVLAGPVGHDEIPAYLDLFDIAVQPAANPYCCPMKILEYMAMGKAIVAPRQANVEELLAALPAELFVPNDVGDLGRALQTLVDDPAKRRRTGQSAREMIERGAFSWVRNVEFVIGQMRAYVPASP